MKKELDNIAKNIRSFRQEMGWTQRKLGEMAGLPAKHISQLECGDSHAGKHVIAKICEAFGIDEATLRYGRDKKEERHEDDRVTLAWSVFVKAFDAETTEEGKNAMVSEIFAVAAKKRR